MMMNTKKYTLQIILACVAGLASMMPVMAEEKTDPYSLVSSTSKSVRTILMKEDGENTADIYLCAILVTLLISQLVFFVSNSCSNSAQRTLYNGICELAL